MRGSNNVHAYQVVFLHRTAKDRDVPEYAAVRAAHLDYVEQQRHAGYVRLYGAVRGEPSEEVSSVFLYRMGSTDEARRIAEHDPLVEKGWIAVSVGEFVTGWKG
jgi:uncharacterized protein YciI